MRILILGATGYVGSRLVPLMLEQGHAVRCLVRDPDRAASMLGESPEIVGGDVLEPDSLASACGGMDVVYHLVHSMGAGEQEFESLDRRAAENVARAAADAEVERIVYLGGLGKREAGQSPHLRSRHEVGEILRAGTVPVIEFRAAVIVGAGSLSFQMIHYLVQRVPVMICPRWVFTRTQPIAITDVLDYLLGAAVLRESGSLVVDIGGPEVLSYGDMMLKMAEVIGLRRGMIRVPVLTPRLSSYWVDLVTPIPVPLARALVEGLRHETVCEDLQEARRFAVEPIGYEQAVRNALAGYLDPVPLPDSGSANACRTPPLDIPYIRRHRVARDAAVSADRLFAVVTGLGGDRGWYFADWLWRLRGWIDRLMGGPGLRRGRRHPEDLQPGDRLDFWRVVQIEPDRRLLLRAEMKVWGQAWLEFVVAPDGPNRSRLIQTAYYYPRGLSGHLYWWFVYSLHVYVFGGMVRTIVHLAEESSSVHSSGPQSDTSE